MLWLIVIYPLRELSQCGDEEGVRFGVTLLGCRGLTGSWGDDWLDKQDNKGISLAQALRDFGLVPEQIHQAKRKSSDFICYLELHIEQGPLLESEDLVLILVLIYMNN